ncbi:MAG: phenylacetate--CoA ligase family protein [Lachnospiraceae bacterium]|nr:phenylacetate--CoA ligase family protein [Lachnospiraceae bacterium]
MDFRVRDYVRTPGKLLEYRKWMKNAPYLPKEEMEKHLVRQLRELCVYAENHIPFYREWFAKAGFVPEKMESLNDYQKLPVLDKDTVRKNQKRMISDEKDKLGACFCETSGSTGTPLQFYLDQNINAASFLLFYRTWSMAPDWNILKTQAALTGYENGEYTFNPINRILYLSSFHLNEETAVKFYGLIKKYRVKVLRGYPSALYVFGKLLKKQGLTLSFPVIFAGSETLLEYQRAFIEEFFQGKVIDHYTHWERTASVCECMEGRLHAQNDYGYHEILDRDGNPLSQGVGRLVCSSLYNKVMPLFRYDTRDLAEWGQEQKCPCGCRFPVVKRIVGRIEDIVVTPEGNYVGRLDAAFKYNSDIKYAFIRQFCREAVEVNLCVDEGFQMEREQPLLEAELRKRLGAAIQIIYRLVGEEEVPFTPAGKVRFVVSEVEGMKA